MSDPTLLFAGGGSGGHVFPLIAVADQVLALAPAVRIVFVGTERGMEKQLVPARGYALEFVQVQPMRGSGIRGILRGASSAATALPRSFELLRRHRPRAVFSIGGYAAGPLALAARISGIPVALMEPNAEIGLSNRLVAPLVQRAYLAFARAARYFPRSAVLTTGVPLREGFHPTPYRRTGGPLRILVLGGSQGAKVLNEAVPQALRKLDVPLSVLHQCGSKQESETRALYERLGLAESARVVPFIEDMPSKLVDSDLVIGRAGAVSTSEICAVGRASLLVPYPYAGDHQRFNALALQEEGASVCLLSEEATFDRLAENLSQIVQEPGRLERMAENARKLGRPEAARAIAEDLLRLSGLGANADSSGIRNSGSSVGAGVS